MWNIHSNGIQDQISVWDEFFTAMLWLILHVIAFTSSHKEIFLETKNLYNLSDEEYSRMEIHRPNLGIIGIYRTTTII